MMGWWSWDSAGWLGMGAWMILWVIVIVAIVWLLVRALTGERGRMNQPAQQAAEEILRQRFARGEINEDEYRQRLAVLKG